MYKASWEQFLKFRIRVGSSNPKSQQQQRSLKDQIQSLTCLYMRLAEQKIIATKLDSAHSPVQLLLVFMLILSD
jgi:hypothetical protein